MRFRALFLFAATCFLCPMLATAGVMNGSPLVSYEYAVTIVGGPFDGQLGTGEISHNSLLLTGVGSEVIAPLGSTETGVIQDPLFNVTVDILGFNFDAANDVDFPDLPSLDFLDGVPTSLDYLLVNGENGVDFGGTGIEEISIMTSLSPVPGANIFTGTATVTLQNNPVPEPSSLAAFAMLAGSAIIGRRRRS